MEKINTVGTQIINELQEAQGLLHSVIYNDALLKNIENAAAQMIQALRAGNKIIACGNGGSMCDAMHFAAELTGKFMKHRLPLAAIAISDPAHISCVANDYGYGEVFARYIAAHANSGDVVLLISTSGTSVNIRKATSMMPHDVHSVLLTGKNQCDCCDIEINVPSGTTARIQEMHIKILHILVMLIERGLGLC